jgi:hypothetical protein
LRSYSKIPPQRGEALVEILELAAKRRDFHGRRVLSDARKREF